MRVLHEKNVLEFGEFQLDADKNVLRRDGEIVSLPLKAVELLAALVENNGEVVTKDELMSRVWADSFVEDSVLTQNIYLLRKTLNTNGSRRGLIKTIPRRGYLFEGEVSTPGRNEARGAVIETHRVEKIDVDVEEKSSPALLTGRTALYAASVLLIGSVIAIGFLLYTRQDPQTVGGVPPLRIKPASTGSGYKTVAVLPFTGNDPSFARAFSGDVSTRLGAMNKFGVKPAALVDEYAKNDVEIRADYVLQGNISIQNGKYSARFVLRDIAGATEILKDELTFADLAQLQDATANRTSNEIQARFTQAEKDLVAKRLPSNVAAYENYQTGSLLWRRRSDGSPYLRRAIELDQSFAPAYAMLANLMATQGVKDSAPAREAQALLDKAFALDDRLPNAYAVQGFIRIFHHHDWSGAEATLRSALELDPNNVNARHWLGVYYSIHRRLDEAKAEMTLALDQDPTNPTLLGDIGQLHYFAGERAKAVDYFKRALTFDPQHSFANEYLKSIDRDPDTGNDEVVLTGLEKAAEENNFVLPYINVDPRYDAIRSTPRFQRLLRRMKL